MDSTTDSYERRNKISGRVRDVIKVTVIIISLGYLIMWFILPTDLYKNTWKPKLRAKLTTTYFGTQGLSILIFTTPVILVAVLASIYAHLAMKFHDYTKIGKKARYNKWASWRRPVLLRWPIGVVSWIELTFLIMFIVLLIWSFAMSLHVGFDHIKHKHGDKRWLEKWKVVVFRLGPTGNICLSLLFYPVTRASTILPLFGLSSEASIKYHMWLGHTLMVIFTTHGLGYLIYWAISDQLSMAIKWKKTGVSNISGEISLLFGLILWAATFSKIRRKMFEVFFYTHHFYILFVFFYFFHVGISYSLYMLPSFYIFVIDRYLRFLQSRQRVQLLCARALPCGVIELNFAKSPTLSYNPTSIVFINIPVISKLQWHPFSVCSSSNLENDRLNVLIKTEGKWTTKLYDLVMSSSIDRLEVSVEGPHGFALNHYLRYDSMVMISGESGITPFFSIIRELLFTCSTLNYQVPKILMITSFRKSKDLAILNLLLPQSSTPYDLSKLDLQIKAYVTRQKHGTQGQFSQPLTIWFNPSSTDEPICPILGKSGYLWLGAIILSTFISFLILIGILTRYYIYPIDHKIKKFPYGQRTILSLFILCGCIIITSSFAVILNKKRNVAESANQSRNTNADRELETAPNQSILESVEVHYGRRPDLKIMLLSITESNVGVLVSGPEGMKHQVAAICGSGLANNLQFESLSFTW